MMPKKFLLVTVGLVFLIGIFSMNFVSAQTTQPSEQTTQPADRSAVGDTLINAAEFFFGGFNADGQTGTGELFFIKLLVFIVVFALASYAIRRIPTLGDSTALRVTLAFIVSLMGVRYITNEAIINFIWLPYGVLAIAFSSLFPFIVGFLFIQSFDSSALRKFSWSMFFVIFAAIGYFRWDTLKITVSGIDKTAWYSNLGMIYVIVAILSLLLIFFDGQVRSMRRRSEFSSIEDAGKRRTARHLARVLDERYEELKHARGSHRTDIKNEIADLKRNVRAL